MTSCSRSLLKIFTACVLLATVNPGSESSMNSRVAQFWSCRIRHVRDQDIACGHGGHGDRVRRTVEHNLTGVVDRYTRRCGSEVLRENVRSR